MKKILATTTLALALAGGAQAATVVNGGFDGDFMGQFSTLGNGSTTIGGWTVGGTSVDWINAYWQAADADGHSVDLSGGGPGSVSQVLTGLVSNMVYKVSFYLAGNPDQGGMKYINVQASGATQIVYSFNNDGSNSKAAMGWVKRTYTFTATGPTATLSFSSLNNSAYGPALDNVSIAAVPVPAAGLLLGGVLGGLAALRRRKRA